MLREELAVAFNNANACPEDLDRQIVQSMSTSRTKSLVLHSGSMHALKPQKAVKDLALAYFKQDIVKHDSHATRSERQNPSLSEKFSPLAT